MINRLTGNTAGLIYHPDKRMESDPQRRCPDVTRARSLLGWEPKVDLEEGLQRTIRILQRQNGSEMSLLTTSQEKTRFIRFIAVGAIGAVVDFGIMNLLSNFFHMPLTLAGTISFICAIISNFLLEPLLDLPRLRVRARSPGN